MRALRDDELVAIVESSDGFLEDYETDRLTPPVARERIRKIADDAEHDGVRVLWADDDRYHGESILILQGDHFMVSIEIDLLL